VSEEKTTIRDSVRDPVRESVRDYYASAIKLAGQSSCCGGGEQGGGAQFYDPSVIDVLPVDVDVTSFGCGDPVTIASLNPGETVLDLGSGAGLDCFLAARQVGETGRVIGVDMTPEMLEKANANRNRLGAANVEFRQGHIEALPVDDAAVDVVISNCVINLSPDKAAVFAESFRVLKPGGRLSVSDIVTEGDFTPEQRAEVDAWAACITGAVDVDEYLGLIRNAGFADIEVVSKVESDSTFLGEKASLPRIYSARITATKPMTD